jgi:hypothetical protein
VKRLVSAARVVGLSWGLCVTVAHAAPEEARSRAEAAYRDVDFEATRAEATRALEAGGNSPAQTARLFFLLGLSHSALGDTDSARDAFLRVLLIDPQMRMDRSISPQLRGPYLEARGFWEATTERLGAKAVFSRSERALLFTVTDPLQVSRRLRVQWREARAGAVFKVREFELSAAALRWATPAAPEGFEVALSVLDAHGNVLLEAATHAAPLLVAGGPERATEPAGEARPPRAPGWQRNLGWTSIALGAGAGAAAVGFQLRREELAREWNGPACEVPGRARAAQCSGVDRDRARAQNLAWISAGVSTALMSGGVFLALKRSPADAQQERRTAVRCGPRFAPLLRGTPGAEAVCQGRF